jgi:hypothetical protein
MATIGLSILVLSLTSPTKSPEFSEQEMQLVFEKILKDGGVLDNDPVTIVNIRSNMLTVYTTIPPDTWRAKRDVIAKQLTSAGWLGKANFEFCRRGLRFVEVLDCKTCKAQQVKLTQHDRGRYQC